MDVKQSSSMKVICYSGRKSYECYVVKCILLYNRPRFFETEENSLPTNANINITNSNLITQTASIDILLFYGME